MEKPSDDISGHFGDPAGRGDDRGAGDVRDPTDSANEEPGSEGLVERLEAEAELLEEELENLRDELASLDSPEAGNPEGSEESA